MLPANGYLDASSAITSTIAPTLIATSGQPQNSAPPTLDMANPYKEKRPAKTPTPAKVSAPLVSAVRTRVSFPAAVVNGCGCEVSTAPIRLNRPFSQLGGPLAGSERTFAALQRSLARSDKTQQARRSRKSS